MIDLDDERTGKIAEVISNKTAKKILGSLAEKEMSEGDIVSELKIPANTVNYNMKKLEDAGLVEKAKGFLWSVKGKRIHRYRVVSKRIVISPKSFSRGLLPSVLISGIIALGIKIFVGGENSGAGIVKSVGTEAAESGGERVAAVIVEAGDNAVSSGISDYAGGGLYNTLANAPNSWAWFFLGALVALLIIVLWDMNKRWGK